jgi:hypothetical protein
MKEATHGTKACLSEISYVLEMVGKQFIVLYDKASIAAAVCINSCKHIDDKVEICYNQ